MGILQDELDRVNRELALSGVGMLALTQYAADQVLEKAIMDLRAEVSALREEIRRMKVGPMVPQ